MLHRLPTSRRKQNAAFDWRLPTKRELESLVYANIAAPGTAIDVTYFPNELPYVWSGSSFVANPASAWFAAFGDVAGGLGGVHGINKSGALPVQLVRGGQF